MASDNALPFENGEWLTDLIGSQAVRVLDTLAVPCLHWAHWQATARYRQEDWTNSTTFGVDRYHCFCWAFGEAVERYLPTATVRRPTDRLGTPFTIEDDDWLIYPWRYGQSAEDPSEGLRFAEENGIRSRLVPGRPADQLMLDYQDLPAIELSKVIILAWAGSPDRHLVRAFAGRPYLDNGRVYWHQKTYELDITVGQEAYAAPAPSEDDTEHSRVPPPPPLNLERLAADHGLLRPTGTGDG